jgi:predicted methyltransferase
VCGLWGFATVRADSRLGESRGNLADLRLVFAVGAYEIAIRGQTYHKNVGLFQGSPHIYKDGILLQMSPICSEKPWDIYQKVMSE